MFRNLEGLIGWTVVAMDGDIGRVKGFIIDDSGWVIRYMAVECGSWLRRKEAIISAASFLRPEGTGRFPVKITREQIEHAPAVDPDRAVSRTGEIILGTCYGWPNYGEAAEGLGPAAVRRHPSRGTAVRERSAVEKRLKRTCELETYEVMADDGEIGRITGLVFDDINWGIYYLVVDADAASPGKKIALATAWVSRVNAASREITMGLSLQKVKDSPAYNAARLLDRQFEEMLYRYYGMPPYWRR